MASKRNNTGKKNKTDKSYRVAKRTYTFKELSNMSESELKSVKKLLRDNVTRNLRKLKKYGYIETPATIGISKAVKSGIVSKLPHLNATPSEASKNVRTSLSKKQLLMGEIFELQKYQRSSTGTVLGMRTFESATSERVGDAYRDSSLESKRKFWELYDEQRKMIEGNTLGSKELQKELADYFSAKNGESITAVDSKEWKSIVDAAYDKSVLAKKEKKSPSPFRLNT